MKTHDKDVRIMLLEYLKKEKEESDLIVQEWGICSSYAIIDVAWISDIIHGYEIKSDSDTLTRLRTQVQYYNRVFDKMTLVVSPRLVEEALLIVPEWWGIIVADFNGFNELRIAENNPFVDTRSFLELLWSNEMKDLLKEHGLWKGMSGKSRRYLWDRAASSFTYDFIRGYAIACFKKRKKWKEGIDNL